MSESDSTKISVEDAIRLKHALNMSIRHAGYSAREIEALERLNGEQCKELAESLSHIKRVWWVFPDWFMAVSFLAALGSLFYFDGATAHLLSVLVMVYCAFQVAYRWGVYYGFVRGFEDGNTRGVHRALGISAHEAAEIHERAREMEVDERVISALDEGKNQPRANRQLMALQLIKLRVHPSEMAVTKVGSVAPDGAFFLDFSRPLERIRWFGVQNHWFGLTVGLLVPVVHQGERTGGYVISVHRSDPYFADVRALWKARYPSERTPPTVEADGLKIIGDFARQFPEDSR